MPAHERLRKSGLMHIGADKWGRRQIMDLADKNSERDLKRARNVAGFAAMRTDPRA